MTTTDQYVGVVLLIEDDAMLSRLYEEKFSLDGFKVLKANNGEQGLRLAQEEEIDVILLDEGLPVMKGSEMLARLRKEMKGHEVPVIVLTNNTEEDKKKRMLALGAKEYLVKAMQTPEEVVQTAKKYMNNVS